MKESIHILKIFIGLALLMVACYCSVNGQKILGVSLIIASFYFVFSVINWILPIQKKELHNVRNDYCQRLIDTLRENEELEAADLIEKYKNDIKAGCIKIIKDTEKEEIIVYCPLENESWQVSIQTLENDSYRVYGVEDDDV